MRILHLCLLSLVASHCTSCTTYKSKPLSAEQSSADFATRSLSDAGLRTYLAEQKAAGRPWHVDQLALVASYFHPDMAVARAEAAEAAAAVKTAQQRPNPVLSFSPQFASNHVGLTPWFMAQNLAIPLETAGKLHRRTQQALAAAEAAQWRVSARAWAARSRVRTAMLELHKARENTQLLRTEDKLHQDTIKKLTAQMEAGQSSPFELTQARLALNRSHLALLDAQRSATAGETKLAAAVGVPSAAMQGIKLDFSTLGKLPTIAVASVQKKALTQRADLMALLADYAGTEAGLRLEIAKQYPDLRVTPGYDYNQGQNRWQLGLSLELPLNQNKGQIAQAEAKRKTAEAKFLAQQATIQGDLATALATYSALRSKVATASALVKDADAAAESTRQSVVAGELSPLESTRRQLEASTAKLALMAAETEAQTAAGALEDAMQAPLP